MREKRDGVGVIVQEGDEEEVLRPLYETLVRRVSSEVEVVDAPVVQQQVMVPSPRPAAFHGLVLVEVEGALAQPWCEVVAALDFAKDCAYGFFVWMAGEELFEFSGHVNGAGSRLDVSGQPVAVGEPSVVCRPLADGAPPSTSAGTRCPTAATMSPSKSTSPKGLLLPPASPGRQSI